MLALLVVAVLALWPGMTAGVVDWNTAWLWPDLLRLSALVRSLALIGVAGAVGGAWREMRRRMTARDAFESSIYTAGISAMQIVIGGMIPVLGWLVVGSVLLGANSNTSLVGVNAGGLVALAVITGYFGPETLRLFSEKQLSIFRGRGVAGDTTGNSPGTKWTAFNAIAEHLDHGRRYTARTNQVQRSFEDTATKQRALDLVAAA